MELNFIDKIVSFVSPKRGLDRARARHTLDQFRKYDAASRGKRAKGWQTSGSSADNEINVTGSIIRNRARGMVRNNPYIRKAVRVVRTSVVGSGIKLAIRSKQTANARRAKQLWKQWAESTACDFMGRKNLYGIQRLVINAVYVDGEVFIRRRRNAKKEIPFELQVLEADFLDTTKNYSKLENGGRIDHGIETDAEGRKVAYWMYQQHPHDNTVWRSLVSVRVPADEVLHIYSEERPGQLRGVSQLVASMFRLRDFDEYEDAQLIRQKIAACFAAFVTGDGEVRPGDPDADGGLPLERVEPGIIEYLPPGKQVTFGNPPETRNYDEYARKILQGAAAGAGLTYESLTGDLSNVNFSSGRMGWIEMNRFVKEWQEDQMILQLCMPVWEWFVEAATIKGHFTQRAKFDTSWTAPRREMIDPVKETKGLTDSVRAGLASWQDTVRELGGDPEILEAEFAEDMAMFDRLGAMFASDPRHDPQRKEEQPEDQKEDD